MMGLSILAAGDGPAVELRSIDLAVIVLYFVVVLGFGSFFGRYTKSTSDFFFSGHRFSWWLIAMSCVATVVGSYSFIKYSANGFKYGMSTTMAYLNDWFVIPFFIFGWLPIIYFARVKSIPDYFERRFDRPTRFVATVFVLLYLIGYIGINFFTLGRAMEAMFGWNLYTSVGIVAIISAIYITAGGQTAVIMTDLLQGFLLLIAGFALFGLGIAYVGGWNVFWETLPAEHRLPLPPFNRHPSFPGVGVFWQDTIANSVAFYFMNQGIIMRFLAARSVRDGRRAILFVALVLMPVATFAISNAGWIGRVLVEQGVLPAGLASDEIFVRVANVVCRPGVFGVVMASVMAALMSTVDTLINASAAVFVFDVYRQFFRKEATDAHYLVTGRVFSVVATGLGVLLVPVYAMQKTIYEAHAMFTAAITPPMVVAILLGAFWRRYNARAALLTLVLGGAAIGASFVFADELLGNRWVSFGIAAGGYKFTRAFYGLLVSFLIGVIVSCITKPQPAEALPGLVVDSLVEGMRTFKGGEVNWNRSRPLRMRIRLDEAVARDTAGLSASDLTALQARPGDMLFVSDARWWLGGLRSCHVHAGGAHAEPGVVRVHPETIKAASLLTARAAEVRLVL